MNRSTIVTLISAAWLIALLIVAAYGVNKVFTTQSCPPDDTSLEWDTCIN